MSHYDASHGLWQTEGWWNAANTTTVLGQAAALSASKELTDTLQNTFTAAPVHFARFLNEYYDDEGWWALAWIQAYDVTHRKNYLMMAESIFTDMEGGWDNTCGGGIWWKKDRHYKNAIANELFLSVAAHLAAREHGNRRKAYMDWAERERDWFEHSGMVNEDHLVNDGLTSECRNNRRTTWSYNQGVLIGGLAELSIVTGNTVAVKDATLIAHATIDKLTDRDHVLHDKTEPNCSADTVQFKGIFLRNLAALQRISPSEDYVQFIRANSDSIWSRARTSDNEFACSWTGPARSDGAAASTSALDALIAHAAIQ